MIIKVLENNMLISEELETVHNLKEKRRNKTNKSIIIIPLLIIIKLLLLLLLLLLFLYRKTNILPDFAIFGDNYL